MAYERKVNYYETDQMAIVHHSNYIRWMEEARISFLEKIGLPYDEMEKSGVLIPVLAVSCEYKTAFRFGDTFYVELKLIHFNGLKFSLAYSIFHKATGECFATGESKHCFLTKELKPIRIKKEYPHIYDTMNDLAK